MDVKVEAEHVEDGDEFVKANRRLVVFERPDEADGHAGELGQFLLAQAEGSASLLDLSPNTLPCCAISTRLQSARSCR